MEEKDVQQLLMEILYVTVNDVEDVDFIKQRITPKALVYVYHLAKKHDLAHVISRFVSHCQIPVDPELKMKLQREEFTSVYRLENMKYAFEEICGAFEEAEIAYVPLKGSVIRPYYPYESMRTSCDIDILIHEEDLETAINRLEAKGYACGTRKYHDVSLFSPNKIHLELHFNIQENKDHLDAVLKDAWNYATPTTGARHAFSKDFFAFHMFAHMAYHFTSGGCGVRSLLDIWVMEQKMGFSYSCAKDLLEKAGIYSFAMEMSRLSKQYFTDNRRDAFADLVLDYIFKGGIYGSVGNQIAVYRSKNRSSVGYLFKRLFLPYKTMVHGYPILKKAPYLLPFCWIARWLGAIFGGKSKRIAREMSHLKEVSDENVAGLKEMCSRLGI